MNPLHSMLNNISGIWPARSTSRGGVSPQVLLCIWSNWKNMFNKLWFSPRENRKVNVYLFISFIFSLYFDFKIRQFNIKQVTFGFSDVIRGWGHVSVKTGFVAIAQKCVSLIHEIYKASFQEQFCLPELIPWDDVTSYCGNVRVSYQIDVNSWVRGIFVAKAFSEDLVE